MEKAFMRVIIVSLLIIGIHHNTWSAASSTIPAPTYTLQKLRDLQMHLGTGDVLVPMVPGLIAGSVAHMTSQNYTNDNTALITAAATSAGATILATIALMERESNDSLINRATAFSKKSSLTPNELIELRLLYTELHKRFTSPYTPWNWTPQMQNAYHSSYLTCLSHGITGILNPKFNSNITSIFRIVDNI